MRITFQCSVCGVKKKADVPTEDLELTTRPAKTVNYCKNCEGKTVWNEIEYKDSEWVEIEIE